MAHNFGGIAHAAVALGYGSGSVVDLQNAVAAYCGGEALITHRSIMPS